MRVFISVAFFLSGAVFAQAPMSDDQIAKEIVKESIANHKGICPCPYSIHPDGRQCGYRSTHSTKSTPAPICYSIAVTPKMIEDFKSRHKP